jgi:hypothetical protein
LYKGTCDKCSNSYFLIIWNKYNDLTEKEKECLYCTDEVDKVVERINYKKVRSGFDSYLAVWEEKLLAEQQVKYLGSKLKS